MVTPMELSFKEKYWRPGIFPSLKEKLKDAPPFFRDTKLNLQFRTFYMDEHNGGAPTAEAWAAGGALSYQSGWFKDHFQLGAVGYTSQPVYAPATREGTLLLGPDQEGYTVLGQAYGRVKVFKENFLNVYRYRYDTPYLNANDIRMTPNTFEAYTLTGTYGGKQGASGLRYGMGYIDKIKPLNSDRFVSMSEAAGVSQVKRGVWVAGANLTHTGFQIGAIDYYCEDVINIFYGETRYLTNVTDDLGLLFAAQFTDQSSMGSKLLAGSNFHTNQFGLMANISYHNGIVTLAYTTNSTGGDVQNPWSGYAGYTGVIAESFKQAGEKAFMLKLSYNFTRFGLDSVAAYALWVHGWGSVDPVTKSPIAQQDEYELDLQWRPKSGLLDGLWFRFRYAYVGSRDGRTPGFPVNDVRFILNYDLELF